MANNTITLDFERINSTFQNAVPEYKLKLDAKKEKPNLLPAEVILQAQMGFLGIPGTDFLDDGIDNVCEAWPKINGLFNTLLRVAAWLPNSVVDKRYIALAKGWLEMANTDLYPQICSAEVVAKIEGPRPSWVTQK